MVFAIGVVLIICGIKSIVAFEKAKDVAAFTSSFSSFFSKSNPIYKWFAGTHDLPNHDTGGLTMLICGVILILGSGLIFVLSRKRQ